MESYRDSLQVISGLTHDKARANGDGAGDHARACSTFLTGKQANKHESKIRSGKSMDQFLADKYNGITRFDSLQFTGSKARIIGKCDSGYSCAYQYNLSWKSASQPMASMYDPQDVFNRLFNVEKIEQKKKLYKKSILDLVLEESRQLSKNIPQRDKAKLEENIISTNDIPVVRTDRGGQVTYHGPGQLTIYFLLNLRRLNWGPKKLICEMESLIIDLLEQYEINASRRTGAPGIYVQDKKIASIGLKIKRGFCYHGISLNVDMDMKPFDGIVTCGIDSLEVTQIKEFSEISIDDVKRDFLQLIKSQGARAA